MHPDREEAFLEFCRFEREALARIKARIASQQLGDAFKEEESDSEESSFRSSVVVVHSLHGVG